MTIIDLETDVEKDYTWFLSEFIVETKESNDQVDIDIIRSFWNNEDSWEDILEKASCEDSRWYVWWMDGVRKYIQYEQEKLVKNEKKVELCRKCGLPKTDSWTHFLDDPNVSCFAHRGDSQATRFCLERQVKILLKSARTGWESAKLFAVQYGGRATEKAAAAHLHELDSMEKEESG